MRGRWISAGVSGAGLALVPSIAGAAEGLNLAPRPGFVLANLIVVLALIWPVNRWLVAPLVRLLQEREARTQGSSDAASGIRAETATELASLEARRLQARRDAAERRSAILARAKAEEQGVLDTARADAAAALADVRRSIEAEVEQARATLRDDARALAQLAAERILGRPL